MSRRTLQRLIAWGGITIWLASASVLLAADERVAPRSEGPQAAWLAGLLSDLRQEKQLVGMGAMATVDGQLLAAAVDGERVSGSNVPIELGDRWHLGSITKSITATMIARLVESGRLAWPDTVGQRFANESVQDDWKPVTLTQLLTHTAGAPPNFSLWVMLDKPELGAKCVAQRRKAVVQVLSSKPVSAPGAKFAYSNVGYTIAGAIAETATGKAWDELVRSEVYQPLELGHAGFGPPESTSKSPQQPHGHTGPGTKKTVVKDGADITTIVGPAGTAHMTLADLAKYTREHLLGEQGAGQLLSAETYRRLHTPVLDRYAYGWVVNEPSDEIPHKVYWHNGSNTMWYALAVFVPEQKLVVTATANDGDVPRAEAAAWKIVAACSKLISAPMSAGEAKP